MKNILLLLLPALLAAACNQNQQQSNTLATSTTDTSRAIFKPANVNEQALYTGPLTLLSGVCL